jgi:hypothetical protein
MVSSQVWFWVRTLQPPKQGLPRDISGQFVMSYHHYHQQGLSSLASSVLKYQAIFFLNFLDYVFVSVHSMKIGEEFCLMATSVPILGNFPFFRVSVHFVGSEL